jgi:hypothetical protein
VFVHAAKGPVFVLLIIYQPEGNKLYARLIWQPSVLAYQRVYRWFWMERDCNTLIFFIVDGKKKSSKWDGSLVKRQK